jgi:hypothetical protein
MLATVAALMAADCSDCQDVPFQRSITCFDLLPGPNAMQLVMDAQLTCWSAWLPGTLTDRHDLPFQAAETGLAPTARQLPVLAPMRLPPAQYQLGGSPGVAPALRPPSKSP